ncbi:VPLPA-CTERM sorting domain-containing protein [Allohahella marinimesophila]|uniref:Secreted protein n=1 Tax=Allohahella marinimesophila TaxID=1054972 RepID=A0ABP7PF00_9GAMM
MTAIGKFLAFTALSVASSVAFSASVPAQYTACNNGGNHAFGLTSATSCLNFGSGNIQGDNASKDAFLNGATGEGYSYINKFEGATANWTQTDNNSGYNTFTFSIEASLWNSYDDIAIGVKVGNKVNWAVWAVENLATSFELFVAPEQGGGLSHINIYGSGDGPGTGVDNPTPVPLPAAAWLFLSGLAGLVGFHKRKAAAKA